jgi:hypothetical protein
MDTYHQKYASLPDEEIENRLNEKKQELITIFNQIKFDVNREVIKIAVLGCGDKRFIRGHKKIFKEILNKTIEIYTFDITIEHLQGKEGVVKHDCTLPLPNLPYAITYAHVLLKFIETEKQWDLIKNSYNALEVNGIAIHVLDKENYENVSEKPSDGYFSVPLSRWSNKLEELGIKYQQIPLKYGIALVLIKYP